MYSILDQLSYVLGQLRMRAPVTPQAHAEFWISVSLLCRCRRFLPVQMYNASRTNLAASRHGRQSGCHALPQHSPTNKEPCVSSALRAQLVMEANLCGISPDSEHAMNSRRSRYDILMPDTTCSKRMKRTDFQITKRTAFPKPSHCPFPLPTNVDPVKIRAPL
jgi:hypothetical protein